MNTMKNQFTSIEIQEKINMVKLDHFDIRTVTMGINLLSTVDKNISRMTKNIERLITNKAKDLVTQAQIVEKQYGIPIINKRITMTPAALLLSSILTGNKDRDINIALAIAKVLDEVAYRLNIDFIGGFGALVESGIGYADLIVIESLPRILTKTKRICAFLNIGSTKAGINMDAVIKIASIILEVSRSNNGPIGCAKLVVFCNSVSDNPFMAGGYHGVGQADAVIHIGISGPGVIRRAIERLPKNLTLDLLSREIKNTAFKITRAGELIGQEIAHTLGVKFGSIDVSLAPTTTEGDSVGLILERMGLEQVGTHGTTAALAFLTDAIKKGGVMASTSVGGLSGAFIPVAEDAVLSKAVHGGTLTLDKLEALTAVCSVGLDMICVPGNIRSTTIAAIIADEASIGMVNHKTTAIRIIPVKGKRAGDYIRLGGLFGASYILPIYRAKSDHFVLRKGRIPAPITSFRN